MPREALVIDGTAKTCKGVIAGLERGMRDLVEGDVVLAIVGDIPSRLDVHAWALRKSHRILEERPRGSGYVFYIAKGASGPSPGRGEWSAEPVPVEGAGRDTVVVPETRE